MRARHLLRAPRELFRPGYGAGVRSSAGPPLVPLAMCSACIGRERLIVLRAHGIAITKTYAPNANAPLR